MFQGKDFGLLMALGILAFLAIASPKKILISEGFALTREELAQGEELYWHYCASCHQSGRLDTPQIGDRQAWRLRINQGMQTLVEHALSGFQGKAGFMPAKGGHPFLTTEEVALATAWIVQQSQRRTED